MATSVIEKSLASNVNSLTNKLINFSSTDDIVVDKSFGNDQKTVYKIGQMVFADLRTYNQSQATAVSASDTLFTLPAGFRPNNATLRVFGAVSKSPTLSTMEMIPCVISPNGRVGVLFSGSFYQFWLLASFVATA